MALPGMCSARYKRYRQSAMQARLQQYCPGKTCSSYTTAASTRGSSALHNPPHCFSSILAGIQLTEPCASPFLLNMTHGAKTYQSDRSLRKPSRSTTSCNSRKRMTTVILYRKIAHMELSPGILLQLQEFLANFSK